MKLTHVYWGQDAPLTSRGQFRRSMSVEEGFDMTYLSRLGFIEITHEKWKEEDGPLFVQIPAVRCESMTAVESLNRK